MIYQSLLQDKTTSKKSLAVLLDPDKIPDGESLDQLMKLINSCSVDYIFYGGSLLIEDVFESRLVAIKKRTNIPVIIFPGSIDQVSGKADAMLFLSLISGRNPELLIGNHVLAAPKVKRSGIEVISTGYMIIDCGKPTTASYISNTNPIPYNKAEIATATAIAGEMLGLKSIYIDGGSGADHPISEDMIQMISKNIDVPLIVGGGIRNHEQAQNAWNAGADIIVIGTAIENDPEILLDISSVKEKH